MSKTYFEIVLTATIAAGCIGCGGGAPDDLPELAEVTGKVTLGGNPLADALVTFSPVEAGRPSAGTTSEDGTYTLQYSVDYAGAKVGEHTITVSPAGSEASYEEGAEGSGGTGDEEDEQDDSGLPPAASDGSIRKTVKAGSNTIDIEL